jgi:hypothetical protein
VTSQRPDLVSLCDWLPPDFGAVGQYALQFARERAQQGQHVALYGLSSTTSSTQVETYPRGSLRVERLRAALYDRSNFRSRAWWTARTNLALVKRSFSDLRATREILFTGSPPFMLHLLAPLNVFLGKRLTYRITDFFPECLMAELDRVPLLLRLFYSLTLFWRRRIHRFEALGEDQRARLLEAGIRPERIVLKRDPSPVPIDGTTPPARRPEQLAGYKVLLYSGNFGVAHDYQTFLDAYRRHHREGAGSVALWLNATGSRADALERALKADGLPHLRTRPVPLEQLASLLVTPDAHLITLHDRFAGYVLPSKVHACIDSGRPVLYIGPASSDVHLLCATRMQASRYQRVDVGDVQGAFEALEKLQAPAIPGSNKD